MNTRNVKKRSHPTAAVVNLSSIAGYMSPPLPVSYKPDHTINQVVKLNEQAVLPIQKRMVPSFPASTHLIVPNIETVHNRVPLK